MRVKVITAFSLILIFNLLICYSAFSASIFTVVGTVRNADDTLAADGLEVVVSNETKKLTVTTTLGKEETGLYGIVFIDMENKAVAAEGDSLKVTVKSEGDILGNQTYKLTSEDMAKARAIVDVKLKLPTNQPPVASFTYSPESPGVGDEITFDASASNDLDGEIVSYQWDFGDGDTDSGERVTHSYDTPYTYVITLTVTDNGSDKGEKMIGLPIPLIDGGSFIMSYSGSPTLEIANLDKDDREQLYNVIKQVLNIGKAKSKLIGEQDEALLSDVNLLLNQLHPDKQDPELSVKDIVKDNALSEEQDLFISLGGTIAGAGIQFLTGIPAPFGLGEIAKQFGLKLGEWLILRDIGSATVEYPNVGRMEIVWLRPPEDKILVNIYLKKPAKRGCMIISVGEWRNELKMDWGVNAGSTVPVWNAFTYPPENTLTDPESIIDHVQIVSLHSPSELRVYDSQGRVTGLVNGEIREEIPSSVYDEERKEAIVFSPSGSYRYEIVGTDEGSYGLTITSVEDGEATTFTAAEVPTSTNATHQYVVDWVVLSEGNKGVTVQMDSDGDGTFEETINTGATFTTEKEYPLDINSDGIVDIFDFTIVGRQFGEKGEDIVGDVNTDGIVDIIDLMLVGSHFGE